MQILPFKPYPYFDWIVLGLCVILAVIRPPVAIISGIWFYFAFHYFCNIVSIKVAGKRFIVPTKHTKGEKIHPFGVLLLVPFLAGIYVSTYGVWCLAKFINNL